MKTTVSRKGQIVLPAELRQQEGIRAGQQFSLEGLNAGEYLRRREPAGDNAGFQQSALPSSAERR